MGETCGTGDMLWGIEILGLDTVAADGGGGGAWILLLLCGGLGLAVVGVSAGKAEKGPSDATPA